MLDSLGDDQKVILDARSPEEYNGLKSPSLRNGRIPGAVNLNWIDTIDRDNNLRFKPESVLNPMLAQLGVARDKEIIVYCQTHHRSSHSFVMLRRLGFDTTPRIRRRLVGMGQRSRSAHRINPARNKPRPTAPHEPEFSPP